MTFEEFQAAKEWSDDLHVHFPDDMEPDAKGWLYCGGRLWIEEMSTSSEDAPGNGQGRWYLRIANMEYQSDDLAELEKPLYDYAKAEEFA